MSRALSKQILILESGDKHYTHVQNNPSSSWIITHNLEKYPSVHVVDTSKNVVLGEIIYNTINQITINFSAPFSGEAFLN